MKEKLTGKLNPETPKQTDTLRNRAEKSMDATFKEDTSNNEGGRDDLVEKAKTVIKNVPRIQLKEYKNTYGYSNDFIERCEYAVTSKQSVQDYSNDRTDVFQKASEPLMTMFLGGEGRPTSLLKNNGSYAIWASTYDDEKRATDIIYGIKSGKDWITCSIDVAALKNDANHDEINKHVVKKFESGANGAFSSMKDFEPWRQEIVFCRRGKQRFTEKKAPHFVLALSNESFKEMTNDIILDRDGQVVGCNPNSDLEFMIATEFLIEINMQIAAIGGKKAKKSEYRDKLSAIKMVMVDKVTEVLGCEVGSEEFANKFHAKVAEMKQKDKGYKDVMDLSRDYKKEYEEVHKAAIAKGSLQFQG
ncbi:MAG: hypothetical protein K6G36_01335 [Candidatus Saccharibacteria bacterium]|nr:hypothetical protein [Candidatus Saccharibacteria bacterium]